VIREPKDKAQPEYGEALYGETFFKNAETQPRDESKKDAQSPEQQLVEAISAEKADWTAEETYRLDDESIANDTLRKLWRIEEALGFVTPEDISPKRVGALLWRMSAGNRPGGKKIWTEWLRNYDTPVPEGWEDRFDGEWCSVDEVYGIAQRAGWRYPVIQNLNQLEGMVGRVEEALVRVGVDIYQSGERLVRPVVQEFEATKKRTTKIAVLVRVQAPFLKSAMTEKINFLKWHKKDEKFEPIGPPSDLVGAILSRYGRWEFREIKGVITAPTLRPDGSILATEGFDESTGLLVLGPLPEMPTIKPRPSKDDAVKALAMLDRDLLSEFPFVDEASRSVALSGILTPLARQVMSVAPMHASSAPAPGTGKSFLWDIAAAAAIGDAMPIISTGASGEELEKRLGGLMIEGVTMFSIDNVSAPLGGDALCQAIERPNCKLRPLGTSDVVGRRNNWCSYATGNNLRLKDDITRRVLLAGLDAKMERPELREFRGNPFQRVLRNRGKYLWACLTVLRAFIVAGQPERLRALASFEEWSDVIRSSLVWLGRADPVVSMEAVRDSDPSRQARRVMFRAMWNAYHGKPVTAAQMIEAAKTRSLKIDRKLMDRPIQQVAEDLDQAIIGYVGDRRSAQYLGNKLNTDVGKHTDGLVLRSQYDSHNKMNLWFVEQVQ
jgi:putative DNA primase/helicase